MRCPAPRTRLLRPEPDLLHVQTYSHQPRTQTPPSAHHPPAQPTALHGVAANVLGHGARRGAHGHARSTHARARRRYARCDAGHARLRAGRLHRRHRALHAAQRWDPRALTRLSTKMYRKWSKGYARFQEPLYARRSAEADRDPTWHFRHGRAGGRVIGPTPDQDPGKTQSEQLHPAPRYLASDAHQTGTPTRGE